jgi:putative peptidoglycan lipid II flippase
LPTGGVAALAYAQTIYLLPISLFGMSISAAALPSMSAAQGEGGDEAREALRVQLQRGLRAIAYPVVPAVVAMLVLGDVICAALFRTGRFGSEEVAYVAKILAGSTIGLLAATQARLYSSAYYALKDTRTPLVFAALRVLATGVLGLICGLWLPRALHVELKFGAIGLTASAGVAGWGEFLLLQRGIHRRIGEVSLPRRLQLELWICAALAGGVGALARFALAAGPRLHPLVVAAIVFTLFGLVYLAMTSLLGVPEADAMLRRLRLKRRRTS